MKEKVEYELLNLMRKNLRIVLLTADDESEIITQIEKEFPTRFYRIGIAECNLLGIAAGLSKLGFISIAYTYGVFLINRALDFLRCDICLNNYNVKIIGWGSGVKINNYGASHHTTEDLGILRTLPGIKVAVPASRNEIKGILDKCVEETGPCYIRIGKAFETEVFETEIDFTFGKSGIIVDGNDLTIISTGNIISSVIEVQKRLVSEGFSVEIINMSSVKPFDRDRIINSIRKTGKVITVEEHQIIGGIGSCIAEVIAEEKLCCKFKRVGFKDKYAIEFGWHKDILDQNGLGIDEIYKQALSVLGKK